MRTVVALALLSIGASAAPTHCDGKGGSKPTGRDMHRAHNTAQTDRVGGKVIDWVIATAASVGIPE